jgi:hypothetical protein
LLSWAKKYTGKLFSPQLVLKILIKQAHLEGVKPFCVLRQSLDRPFVLLASHYINKQSRGYASRPTHFSLIIKQTCQTNFQTKFGFEEAIPKVKLDSFEKGH